MRRAHRWTLQLAALAAASFLAACGDGGTAPEDLGAIVITAPATEFEVGANVQLVATLLNQSGVAMSSPRAVSWTSSNAAVATVSPGGLVTGRGAGSTRITAASDGKSASVMMQVRPQPCSPAVGRTIGVADSRGGTLTRDDCVFHYGQPAQGWRLTVPGPMTLRIELSSSSFPPFVAVTDLHMNVLAGAGVGGGTTTAVLGRDFAAGEYIIWVMNDGAADGGAYQLVTREVQRCTPPNDRAIGTEDQRDGTLDGGDCLFLHDQSAEGWRLDLEATTTLQFQLAATGFPALLVLTDREMNVLNVGFPEGNGGSATIVSILAAGEYIVWVSSYGPGAGGYRLTTSLTTIRACTDPVGSVAIGQSVTGELAATACRVDGQRYADAWMLVVPETATLQIDLMASWDTYLYLADSAAGIFAADDDGGEGLNSRIVRTFAPGEYLILASSYVPGQTGPYQLSVNRAVAISPSRSAADRADARATGAPFAEWLAKRRR